MIPFWKKTGKHSKPQSTQKRRQNAKPAVPRTAQQSIPMQRMFEDGTCRVKPNYYTRTIQYQDINYQLAQQEDKTAIFEESRFWSGAFRRRIPPRSTRWCELQKSRRNSLPPCCGSRLPPPRTRLRCLLWVPLSTRRSMQMKIKKLGALLVSAALCAGMAAPAFAFEGEAAPVEQPILPEVVENVVTVTDETSGALTPDGNLTLVDDYHTNYSDGSGQQFITLVSKSGNTFYLVIDRNAKGQQTVHFMNLVDEADLLALMEEDAADAYTAEKEAAAQAEQERKQAEEDAKKAAEEAEVSGSEQTGGNKVTKYAATFLGVLALVGLVAGGGIYTFMKQKQKKQAEKEALDPDANYTEDKGDFEIPVEDEPEETGEEDNAEE